MPPDRPYLFGYHPHGKSNSSPGGLRTDISMRQVSLACLSQRVFLHSHSPLTYVFRGALATFATEGTEFSKQFPGIRPHLLTLASNFNIPLYREIILMLGICSVSKKSCINILKQGKGSSITIVIGGAAESLSARPGTADLTLRKRYVP